MITEALIHKYHMDLANVIVKVWYNNYIAKFRKT